MGVIEAQLEGRDWIAGEYSIADMAIAPWLNALAFYGAQELVGWDDLPNIKAYVARFMERPAVKIGMNTPARG